MWSRKLKRWLINAHLIASAPELLEACKLALDIELNYMPDQDQHPILIEKLEDAIAKAEGRGK